MYYLTDIIDIEVKFNVYFLCKKHKLYIIHFASVKEVIDCLEAV